MSIVNYSNIIHLFLCIMNIILYFSFLYRFLIWNFIFFRGYVKIEKRDMVFYEGVTVKMSSNYSSIPIIDRMASVLDIILDIPNGITASELLHLLNIPKTTLYRLLSSMVQNELLSYFSETGTYTIGPKFTLTYVSMEERASRLREAAMPHLRALADQIGETVKLSVLSGLQSYTIATVESSRPLRISVDTGALFPLHAGATGKILMCSLNDAAMQRYFKSYAIAYTDATITDITEMKKELDIIRKRGYATDVGEYMPEIYAVAAPVTDCSGQITAAISIAYPSMHKDHIRMDELAAQLQQTAAAVGIAYISEEVQKYPARLIQES